MKHAVGTRFTPSSTRPRVEVEPTPGVPHRGQPPSPSLQPVGAVTSVRGDAGSCRDPVRRTTVRRVHEWQRSPGEGKYARPEVERRFLVTEMPEVTSPPRLIEDRYLDGTSLRLRRLTVDGDTVCKLTQKVRPNVDDPSVVLITNVYLTEGEFDLLAALPAVTLSKSRYVVPVDDARFVVDVFDAANAGLVMAEVEVDDLSSPLPRPAWLGREVTHDDRYSGGQLARIPFDR